MQRRPKHAGRLVTLGATIALMLLWGAASASAAGTYTVNVCGAAAPGYQSGAFSEFANRGMRSKRACNPDGPPTLRGLVTSNVLRSGRVKRGAQSRFVFAAPGGTSLASMRWRGQTFRRDCRYSLQVYALRPDGTRVATRPFANKLANHKCPRPGRTQISQTNGKRSKYRPLDGANRIVQRAVCVGQPGKPFCSARGFNGVTTYGALVTVVDSQPPAATVVQDNPFTNGAWVRGDQTVTYGGLDNTGIKQGQAVVGGQTFTAGRGCDYTRPAPCDNGNGSIPTSTSDLPEGSQELRVQVTDAADNTGLSGPVTVRIDNTAPAGVPVTVEGGEAWRAQNGYSLGWMNPNEWDRAPIAAAHWSICRADGTGCVTGSQSGTGIARLADLRVPDEGVWLARVARADEAGNLNLDYSSPAVQLRLDQSAPTLQFEPLASTDPTRVTVTVADRVSGIASGSIEISAAGSGSWQTLPAQLSGGQLLARIPDESLPPGPYLLRASARDLAGNIGSAASAQLNLPLRVQSTLQAGIAVTKTVFEKKKRGKGKKPRKVQRRQTVLRPEAAIEWSDQAAIAGRLVNRDGQPIPGQPVEVLAQGANGEQLLATLTTDGQGRFSYRAAGSGGSRALRFVYRGSPVVLPAQAQVTMRVAAAGSFKVSRKRILNGDRVWFRGRVASTPLPAAGKLVELQVRQRTGEWTTFRSLRTDGQGRWTLRYRFSKTSCHTRYPLRVRIPAEAGYPFTAGHSRARSVLVRGAQGPCP
jgi:hypothetical protein